MLDRFSAGVLPAKHHTVSRGGDGQLRYEECITRAGFDGPYSIVYHERRPHTQRRAAAAPPNIGWQQPEPSRNRSLAKRHYRTQDLAPPSAASTPLNARIPLLHNSDVTISVARPSVDDAVYFADADADLLVYVHRGRGTLRSPFGDLVFEARDYVYVPRGVLHRFVLQPGDEQHWLTLEFSAALRIPQQFRNECGQLRMDAPYSHRDFRRPTFVGPTDEGLRDLVVRSGGSFHLFHYDASPLDVVGWDGTLYPFAFPIMNFQPRVGLVHLPPNLHGTFAASGALVCSFVPRPLDFHEHAIPCPYPHSSVDIDEVLFYCHGDFTSRTGVGPGSISHHPAGIAHGPHPGAYERSIGLKQTSELAVMLDCARPLRATAAADAIEDAAYHESFIE